MKRMFLAILALAIIGIGLYFLVFRKEKQADHEKDKPLTIKENTATFKHSFDVLLASYFDLKDAFFSEDSVKINQSAANLKLAADSLHTQDIQGDSTGSLQATAKDFALTISGSAAGILGEKEVEGKRKELDLITSALWDLIRTVKYTNQKVYYQFCPMAFNHKGAYWLSNQTAIRNPYFGSKMPECGSTQDSLDYSKP